MYKRQVVDHYIVNQRTASEANDRTLLASIGGQESFDEVSEWANTNLPATEVDQINNVLAAGNTEQSVLVLQGLKNRYQEATGSDPQLLQGSIAGASALAPFESNDQVVEAIRDPKYKTDSAYRDRIQKRIAVSPNIL